MLPPDHCERAGRAIGGFAAFFWSLSPPIVRNAPRLAMPCRDPRTSGRQREAGAPADAAFTSRSRAPIVGRSTRHTSAQTAIGAVATSGGGCLRRLPGRREQADPRVVTPLPTSCPHRASMAAAMQGRKKPQTYHGAREASMHGGDCAAGVTEAVTTSAVEFLALGKRRERRRRARHRVPTRGVSAPLLREKVDRADGLLRCSGRRRCSAHRRMRSRPQGARRGALTLARRPVVVRNGYHSGPRAMVANLVAAPSGRMR